MPKFVIYIIAALVAYLIGSFNTALVISKAKGIDIRKGGSGNLGASNATITLGAKWGIVVGVVDILKGTVPVLLCKHFFPEEMLLWYLVAAMLVMGHMYPFYLGFKGGKGFATYNGIILALDWRIFLITGVAIVLITLISDYIAVATLTVMVTFTIVTYIQTKSPIAMLIIAVPSAIIIIKHLPNVKRILDGSEIGIRSAFTKKNRLSKQSDEELLAEDGEEYSDIGINNKV